MSESVERRMSITMPRYQRRGLAVVFISSLFFCVSLSLFILYGYYQLVDILQRAPEPPDLERFHRISSTAFGTIWVFFFIFLFWGYVSTNRMVGAFERILRELDTIIMNKERRRLKVRTGDDLPKEIVRRINFLLENIYWPSKDPSEPS